MLKHKKRTRMNERDNNNLSPIYEIPLNDFSKSDPVVIHVESTSRCESCLNKCLNGCCACLKSCKEKTLALIKKYWKSALLVTILAVAICILYYSFSTMNFDQRRITQKDDKIWMRVSDKETLQDNVSSEIFTVAIQENDKISDETIRNKRSVLFLQNVNPNELYNEYSPSEIIRCKKNKFTGDRCEKMQNMLETVFAINDQFKKEFEKLKDNSPEISIEDREVVNKTKTRLEIPDTPKKISLLQTDGLEVIHEINPERHTSGITADSDLVTATKTEVTSKPTESENSTTTQVSIEISVVSEVNVFKDKINEFNLHKSTEFHETQTEKFTELRKEKIEQTTQNGALNTFIAKSNMRFADNTEKSSSEFESNTIPVDEFLTKVTSKISPIFPTTKHQELLTSSSTEELPGILLTTQSTVASTTPAAQGETLDVSEDGVTIFSTSSQTIISDIPTQAKTTDSALTATTEIATETVSKSFTDSSITNPQLEDSSSHTILHDFTSHGNTLSLNESSTKTQTTTCLSTTEFQASTKQSSESDETSEETEEDVEKKKKKKLKNEIDQPAFVFPRNSIGEETNTLSSNLEITTGTLKSPPKTAEFSDELEKRTKGSAILGHFRVPTNPGLDIKELSSRNTLEESRLLERNSEVKSFSGDSFPIAETLKTSQQIKFNPPALRPVCYYGTPNQPLVAQPDSAISSGGSIVFPQESSKPTSTGLSPRYSYVPGYSGNGYGYNPYATYSGYNNYGYSPYNLPHYNSPVPQKYPSPASPSAPAASIAQSQIPYSPPIQYPMGSQIPYYCTYVPADSNFQFPVIPGSSDFSKIHTDHSHDLFSKSNFDGGKSNEKKDQFRQNGDSQFRGLPTVEEQVVCTETERRCEDGSKCIPVIHWCDGKVHCDDVSDEISCSCKHRVDKSRICDGYFDCPNGEDELGCFECPEMTFSCDDWTPPTQKATCVPLIQRCDEVKNCPNGKDETDCSMLAETVSQHQKFHVSYSNGFLHHNFKGQWYPVCMNNVHWAMEACSGELGPGIINPEIRIHPIEGRYHGPFLKISNIGRPEIIPFCIGGYYIQCPPIVCGTKVFSESSFREGRDILDEQFEIVDGSELQIGKQFRRHIPESFLRDINNNITSKENLTPLNQQESQEVIEEELLAEIAAEKNSTHQRSIRDSENSRLKRGGARVVGGRASKPAAWPWVVALYRNGIFHCGGVLMNELWVITAAHCVDKYWQHYYEVQAGMLRRFSYSPMEQIRPVSHVVVHEDYNRADMKNDLSLMRLQRPMQFNRWVRNICLPNLDTAGDLWLWGPRTGTICTAVGWGATVEHGPDPDHMREVEVPILSKCKHREDLEGDELCAGLLEGGRDACQGDSGGPLLCKNPNNPNQWFVAGIVSHGEGCARPDEPGAYTRVSVFLNWISLNTMESNLPHRRPLAHCPGLTCTSSGGKCISHRRRCDDIVDCLAAEDEMMCQSKKRIPDLIRQALLDTLLLSTHQNISDELEDNVSEKEKLMLLADSSFKPESRTSAQILESNRTKNIIDENLKTILSTSSIIPLITSTEKTISTPMESTPLKSHERSKEGGRETTSSLPEHISLVTSNLINTTNTQLVVEINPSTQASSITAKKLTTPSITSTETLTSTPIESMTDVTTDGTTSQPQVTNKEEVKETTILTLEDTQTSLVETTISKLVTETANPISSIQPENPASETTSDLQNDSPESDQNITSTTEIMIDDPNITQLPEIWPRLLQFSDIDAFKAPPENKRTKRNFFHCSKMHQLVAISKRCDGIFDCEDGTDEEKCTCRESLSHNHPDSICDGYLDCLDRTDEEDCYDCPEDHFNCVISKQCIPGALKCDEKYDCKFKEDEEDCFTLANANVILIDIDSRIIVKREGIVTAYNNMKWSPICQKSWDETANKTAFEICRNLGHGNYESFESKVMDQTSLLLFNFENKSLSPPEEHQSKLQRCNALFVKCKTAITSSPAEFKYHMEPKNNLDELYSWPWIGLIMVNGIFKCTGVLINPHWVMTSKMCTDDILLGSDYVAIIFGTGKGYMKIQNPFEQLRLVNEMTFVLKSKVALLHLNEPIQYTRHVKALPIGNSFFQNLKEASKKEICVAVGVDDMTNVRTLFLKPMPNCEDGKRCFKQINAPEECDNVPPWSGTIVCESEQGWYPSAIFHENKGFCGFSHTKAHTSVVNILDSIQNAMKIKLIQQPPPSCTGVRCPLGNCVPFNKICDGNMDCRDGNDETPDSCKERQFICSNATLCDCTHSELRCATGRCTSKAGFCNAISDCVDRSDEPDVCSCAAYLRLVAPDKICDGRRNCWDKSDEIACSCSEKNYRCEGDSICIPKEFLCDGDADCPNGDDERHCFGLKKEKNDPDGTGRVYQQSFGVWHVKCFTDINLTMFDREELCTKIGFNSGKAVIDRSRSLNETTSVAIIDKFQTIHLNDAYRLVIRSDKPLLTLSKTLEPCKSIVLICA